MEKEQVDQQHTVDQVYQHAANLLFSERKPSYEVTDHLIKQGIEAGTAAAIVENLENQIEKAKKEQAQKDMLFGALWCVGGIIATVADIGFIFWGAILFGAIQFFKGAANL